MGSANLRAVAKAAGVSIATASRALSGQINVSAETRAKVEAVARRSGYKRNRLAGELMTYVRRSNVQQFVGTIAIIHVPSAEQPRLLPTQKRIVKGASDRALELDFKVDFFELGRDGVGPARLARVLKARGIIGIIFICADPSVREEEFVWEDFSCIEIDFGRHTPILSTVCIDHYLTLYNALLRLADRGYRRIGLFLERYKNERVSRRWSAAYLAFQAGRSAGVTVPVLLADRMEQAEFLAWHAKHQPDLVIGHVDKAVSWMREAGIAVPEATAFFNLNWTARTIPCAGLDLRPELQGSVALDTLTGQIRRRERGIPTDVQTIMIEGLWRDGRTLRKTKGD